MTLRELFKSKDISYARMARELEKKEVCITPQTLGNYNRGVAKPSYDVVVKIAEILEVDFQEVVNALERKESAHRPTTKIIKGSGDWFECDVTSCCGIGPITNENYCPKCGNKLIR